MATPVPIPNTEVKHFRGKNSLWVNRARCRVFFFSFSIFGSIIFHGEIMKAYTYISHSIQETFYLGEKIGKQAFPGFLLLLDGDLGAGKTALTKGIGKGLNVSKTITSPTFNIQKIYKGRIVLNHIDAYRLEGMIQDLGFDEYFDEEAVTVIEWSHFMSYLLPDEYLNCTVTIQSDDSRVYHFEANGKQYENFLEELQ